MGTMARKSKTEDPGRREKPVRKGKVTELAPPQPAAKPSESDDQEFSWDEIPGIEVPGEPNPVEVERMTNQVLDHVLARFGWARNERGQVEHVGEEQEDRRKLKKAS